MVSNYEALKAHVEQTGHFPNKHACLNNWCRYQWKRIKIGSMLEEQKALFEALAASRSDEHTGGCRRYFKYCIVRYKMKVNDRDATDELLPFASPIG